MPDGLPTSDKHTKLLLRVVNVHRDRLGRGSVYPSIKHTVYGTGLKNLNA